MNQQITIPENQQLFDESGIIKILETLTKLIDSDIEEFEFSTGKWSKAWIKIKLKRTPKMEAQ